MIQILAATTVSVNISTKTTMINYSTNTNTTVVSTDTIITHTANTIIRDHIWLTQPSTPTPVPKSSPAPPTHHTVTDTIVTPSTSSRTGFESEPRQFLDL